VQQARRGKFHTLYAPASDHAKVGREDADHHRQRFDARSEHNLQSKEQSQTNELSINDDQKVIEETA
jgi:hypothetical protein